MPPSYTASDKVVSGFILHPRGCFPQGWEWCSVGRALCEGAPGLPLPPCPQPSPCRPAVGCMRRNQQPTERSSPKSTGILPTDSAPFAPLPSTPPPPQGLPVNTAEGRSPSGRGPYRRGSGAGFFPIPFITSPHPRFITQGCFTVSSLLLSYGSRVGEGKTFKSVGLGATKGTAGRGFPHTLNPVAYGPPHPGWAGPGG